MILDLTSLGKAVDSLKAALRVAGDNTFMSKLSPEQADTIRAGVIQTFEFTYELCWKFIQRWLKEHQHIDEAALPRTRKDLFRMAARHSLINHPEMWFDYGNARNMTAHTYNKKTALAVHEVAIEFAKDAEHLLKCLRTKND